jgi:hypothetical protein
MPIKNLAFDVLVGGKAQPLESMTSVCTAVRGISDYRYLLDLGRVSQSGPKEDLEKDIREIIKVSLMARD